jgi:hypothetical protein
MLFSYDNHQTLTVLIPMDKISLNLLQHIKLYFHTSNVFLDQTALSFFFNQLNLRLRRLLAIS